MTGKQVQSSSAAAASVVHDHFECQWWRWWDTTPWNQSGTSWSDTDFMLDHAPLEERFILLLAAQEEQFRWRALGLESFRCWWCWWWWRYSSRASESALVAGLGKGAHKFTICKLCCDRSGILCGLYIYILFFLCRDTTLYPPPVTSVSSGGGRNGYNLCSTRAEWQWRWWWGHMCMQEGNTVKLYYYCCSCCWSYVEQKKKEGRNEW